MKPRTSNGLIGQVRSGDRLDPTEGFEFVRVHQAMHPIATLCRVLGVSASGYYAWALRPASARATADAALSAQLRAIHERSRGTYGEQRIHAELLDLGVHVSSKRIARLMRAMGLAGVSRRKHTITTTRRGNARPAPDLVDRNFLRAGSRQALGPRYQCAAASSVGDERRGISLASRNRLAGAGCKPPQAAWVKSPGRERCGKGASKHQVRAKKANTRELPFNSRNCSADVETGS